jgi:hypothetical protein
MWLSCAVCRLMRLEQEQVAQRVQLGALIAIRVELSIESTRQLVQFDDFEELALRQQRLEDLGIRRAVTLAENQPAERQRTHCGIS